MKNDKSYYRRDNQNGRFPIRINEQSYWSQDYLLWWLVHRPVEKIRFDPKEPSVVVVIGADGAELRVPVIRTKSTNKTKRRSPHSLSEACGQRAAVESCHASHVQKGVIERIFLRMKAANRPQYKAYADGE
ncbi:MAG: hypothetical protein JHD35_03270 [Sphingopyxis sp.]|nr:hypothetical protein [Sphingopyxis sp.]